MKSEAERNVERVTVGAMLVLFGVVFLIRMPGWFFPLAGAVILLGSAYYQRQRGWEVSFWTWLFGILFAILAALDILGGVLRLAWNLTWALLPLVLIGLGVLLLLNIFSKR